MPQTTITLHSEGSQVIALPRGTFANQVLWSSPARAVGDGVYTVDNTGTALDDLDDLARRSGVSLLRSDRPFIGSTAQQLADALHGSWLHEAHNLHRNDEPHWALETVWDCGPLNAALTDSPITSVAVIHHPASEMEFMVAEHPTTHDLLVGPKTPTIEFPSVRFLASHVPTPRGIRASSVADAVKRLVPVIPAFDRSLCEGRMKLIAADLANTTTGSTVADEALSSFYLEQGPRLARRVLAAGTLLASPEEDDLLHRIGQGSWPINRDLTAAWRVDAHRLIGLARATGLGLPQSPAPAPPARPLPPTLPNAPGRSTGGVR